MVSLLLLLSIEANWTDLLVPRTSKQPMEWNGMWKAKLSTWFVHGYHQCVHQIQVPWSSILQTRLSHLAATRIIERIPIHYSLCNFSIIYAILQNFIYQDIEDLENVQRNKKKEKRDNLQDVKLAQTKCQNLSKPDVKISSCPKPTAYNRVNRISSCQKSITCNRSTMVMGGVSWRGGSWEVAGPQAFHSNCTMFAMTCPWDKISFCFSTCWQVH